MTKQASRSAFLKLAGVLALVYLFFLLILYTPVYQSIVLRPDYQGTLDYTATPILGIKPEDISIDSHGDKMHAWLFQVPKSKSIVLVHHGNAGNLLNRLFIAETLIKEKASVLLYDYRGYGKSTGQTSLNNILQDGLAAFDFLKSHYSYPVVINYGESIGSAVASFVDNQRKSAGLILQSGIASLPHVARDGMVMLSAYPDFIWPAPHLDNCALLSKSQTPLLLLHGSRDKLVPISNSDMLFASSASPDKSFIKLPDCGHNDVGIYDCAIYSKAIAGFVQNINVTSH
ncbi:MAG: lysophospholipase [Candidatus Obscuribacterales bacterium]|nr:lysophospholipase [Candidatus Obscuribacterales bacterium]